MRGEVWATDKPLNKRQIAALERLAAMDESEIDLSDVPEITDWDNAVVGKFYRPVKQPVTFRLDRDILAWLRSSGRGYQTRANQILRAAMQKSLQQR